MYNEEYYRDVYARARGAHNTAVATAKTLADFWPPDGGKPWSDARWSLWESGQRDIVWEAKAALCKYNEDPPPPADVTIKIGRRVLDAGQVDVRGDKPDFAIVFSGNDFGKVTLKKNLRNVAESERPKNPKVVVSPSPRAKRRSPRKSVSLSPEIFKRANRVREELGLEWNEFLATLIESYTGTRQS